MYNGIEIFNFYPKTIRSTTKVYVKGNVIKEKRILSSLLQELFQNLARLLGRRENALTSYSAVEVCNSVKESGSSFTQIAYRHLYTGTLFLPKYKSISFLTNLNPQFHSHIELLPRCRRKVAYIISSAQPFFNYVGLGFQSLRTRCSWIPVFDKKNAYMLFCV